MYACFLLTTDRVFGLIRGQIAECIVGLAVYSLVVQDVMAVAERATLNVLKKYERVCRIQMRYGNR